MSDKNLVLVDEIMNTITGSGQGEWDEIQTHDPMIIAADNRFEAMMEQVKALIPEKLYNELYDAHSSVGSAIGDAGILFGIHVADAIRDVASRPADLSRHILKRIEGRATI